MKLKHLTVLALGLFGCGGGVTGSLVAPEPKRAMMTLSAALDVSNLTDPAIADRLDIQEISLGVEDIRLLGANPAIPTGGLALIDRPIVLRSRPGDTALPSFHIPEWLQDEDLAVYVSLGTSEALAGASVVIRGAVLAEPNGRHYLLRDPHEPGPDGEPARSGGDDKEPGPDGEPAECKDPKTCAQRSSLESAGVEFELRGTDRVDLLVDMDSDSKLDVVLGVPAARWFTQDAIDQVNDATESSERVTDDETAEPDAKAERFVLESRESEGDLTKPATLGGRPNDGYHLLQRNLLDPLRFRR